MFALSYSLISLPDISKWNTSNVTNTSGMFTMCYSLTSLPDLSKWDTSKITNKNIMFDEAINILNLNKEKNNINIQKN